MVLTRGTNSPAAANIVARAVEQYNDLDEQRDVFESHRHHVFSVAYYMTGDEREAENVLQSTFLAAFNLHPRPSIEMLDQQLMGQLHARLSLTAVEPVQSAEGPGLGARNVKKTDLEEALWQLPARERLCFLLRDVEGYAPNRIAALLACPEGEVQKTVFSARLRLRNLLVQQAPAVLD
jgi:DNA-directed RNA polymerase specialized sigma24 family protein